MSESTTQRNKAFVLEAFETLGNKKDFVAAEKFWSSNYIQHSAHMPPGRDGLIGLIKSTPPAMKYENSLIMAEGGGRERPDQASAGVSEPGRRGPGPPARRRQGPARIRRK